MADTHALQNGRSPAARWFMEFATAHRERVREGGTAQGFYALTANGTFLGFNNNRSVRRVLRMMEQGLQQFGERSEEAEAVPEELIAAPFCPTPSESASVVRVFSRIQPLPEGAHRSNQFLGRDFLWVTRNELRALPQEDGAESPLPATLVARLVRFHLVDNIRGEPSFWNPEEVRRADFRVRRVPGATPTFTVEGEFAMATADQERGIEGTLRGTLGLDAAAAALADMSCLVESEAWGRGPWTPAPPAGRFPLRMALVAASPDDAVARQVAPQAAGCGYEYLKVAPLTCAPQR